MLGVTGQFEMVYELPAKEPVPGQECLATIGIAANPWDKRTRHPLAKRPLVVSGADIKRYTECKCRSYISRQSNLGRTATAGKRESCQMTDVLDALLPVASGLTAERLNQACPPP